MSSWLNKDIVNVMEVDIRHDEHEELDVAREMEIEAEIAQDEPIVLERIMRRDALVESWRGKRMARELVNELVDVTPEIASENIAKMVAAKRARAEGRMMITSLVADIVCKVTGVSVATAIMTEVVEMALWRAGVNQAWAIMEGDRRVQRLIQWRMDNQRMDERVVLESIERDERLERVGKLQTALKKSRKAIKDDDMETGEMAEEEVEMYEDWGVMESKEHAYLTNLLEGLEMGFDTDTNIEMEECDELDETLEHTILEELLRGWEEEDTFAMKTVITDGGQEDMDWYLEVDAEEDIDECIRTISCKGDCSCDLEVAEKASAPEVGRGENNKDIRNRNIATTLTVHSDSLDNVSECVQT